MLAKPCRVLVIDDDADTREALAEALRGPGFIVELAGNGEEAYALLDPPPDVALVDFRIRGTDTEELLERIRQTGARVIILTADNSARVLDVARSAKLLRKPVALEVLEAAVKEACAA